VGLEPTIPVSERAKTVHALDRSATVTGPYLISKVKVKVTLRLTVNQSLSLGVKPHLGPTTSYLLLCDSYGLVLVGRPL
jgi:hypothetical protein